MRNRSNLLVLLGIAFFVVGGIIVYVLTNDDSGSSSATASTQSSVIVATRDIPAGSLADEVVAEGGLKQVKVPSGQMVAGAVQSLNQLSGATFVQGFAADQQIVTNGLQSLSRTFEVPDGYEAMAIQLDFVAGGAGYVSPGDRVNVFGAFSTQYPIGNASLPRAELLISNVEVLDVDLTVPARRGTTDTGAARLATDTVTFLVAVKTTDAEKLVFTTEFENLYATLLAKDAPAVGDTPGRDGTSILAA